MSKIIELNAELQAQATEIIEAGKRAFVFEKNGKLAIYDGNSTAAYQAQHQQGWEYVGETFNGVDFLKK